MEERRTRKFLKPIKGNGELRKFSRHFAQVRYFLQGWQDFLDSGSPRIREGTGAAQLSGMDGEITLSTEDRNRIAVEEILGQEFTLHIDQDRLYEIVVYKLKDNNPAKGRYSVRCKICY
jgi:hypothetical protein